LSNQSAQLKLQLEKIFRALLPNATEDEIDAVSHDLADWWEIGQRHARRIEAIIQAAALTDRKEVAEQLSDLQYGDLSAEVPWHIESMQKYLTNIIEQLENEQ
jgi:hypothetical protein